jgi:hypothetical protein
MEGCIFYISVEYAPRHYYLLHGYFINLLLLLIVYQLIIWTD